MKCSKCKREIAWPPALTADQRRTVVATAHAAPIEAVKAVREMLGFSLAEAKLVVEHVSRADTHGASVCHRCGRLLTRGYESACANCGAANLDCPSE